MAAHNLHPRMLQFAIKTFCDIQPAGSGPFSVCDDEAEGSVIEPSASVSLGLQLTLPNIQYSISIILVFQFVDQFTYLHVFTQTKKIREREKVNK